MTLYRIRIWLFLITVSLTTSCLTTKQVREIVDESNNAAVVSSISADARLGEPGDDWRTVVNRIETFIAENPDDKRTVAALRIREAVVLLNAGQVNLARAVFDEVDDTQIAGGRDRAIYDAREALLWFYGWDGQSLEASDRQAMNDALISLAEVADSLKPGSGIRRFLEETRVRIAVTGAENLTDEAEVCALTTEPLKRYAGQFDNPADRDGIERWHNNTLSEADAEVLRNLRWYDYAPKPFEDVEAMLGDTTCPQDPTPDWLP